MTPLKVIKAVKIIKYDVPNDAGAFYTEQVIDSVIHNCAGKPVYGRIGAPGVVTDSTSTEDSRLPKAAIADLPVDKVTHCVTNLRKEEGYLVCDVSIFDTPEGKVLAELVGLNDPLSGFRIAGYVNHSHVAKHNDKRHNVVSTLLLHSVNFASIASKLDRDQP